MYNSEVLFKVKISAEHFKALVALMFALVHFEVVFQQGTVAKRFATLRASVFGSVGGNVRGEIAPGTQSLMTDMANCFAEVAVEVRIAVPSVCKVFRADVALVSTILQPNIFLRVDLFHFFID